MTERYRKEIVDIPAHTEEKIITYIECDMCGAEYKEYSACELVLHDWSSSDSVRYKIDLCESCVKKLVTLLKESGLKQFTRWQSGYDGSDIDITLDVGEKWCDSDLLG